MRKQTVKSGHKQCAVALLRMANTGLVNEAPLRHIIQCYRDGALIEPDYLDNLSELCEIVGLPLDDLIRDHAMPFDPNVDAMRSLGGLPLEHWQR